MRHKDCSGLVRRECRITSTVIATVAWACCSLAVASSGLECGGVADGLYTHKFGLDVRDGRIETVSYNSVNTKTLADCAIRAGRSDGRSIWRDFGATTIVSVPGNAPGDLIKISIRHEVGNYSLSILSGISPALCAALGAYIAPSVTLNAHSKVCKLKNEKWGGVATVREGYYGWKAFVDLLQPNAKPDYVLAADLDGDGAENDLVGTYGNETGLLVALRKGKTYQSILDFHAKRVTLDGVQQTEGTGNRKRNLIVISEDLPNSDWHGEVFYLDRSIRVASEVFVPYRGRGYVISRDFENDDANRTFSDVTDNKDGRARRSVQRSIDFKPLLFVKRKGQVTVDGTIAPGEWEGVPSVVVSEKSFVTFHPERWRGLKDLSMEVRGQWDERYVYFGIIVNDDNVVQASTNDEIVKGDHIEIWFDGHPHGAIFENEQRELVVRSKPDNYVRQFAISASVAPDKPEEGVRLWYDGLSGGTKEQGGPIEGAKAASRRVPGGYTIEAQIPIEALGIRSIQAPDAFTRETQPSYLMTIVASDSDDPTSHRQEKIIATSQLRWGNPSTFGEMYFLNKFEIPLFFAEQERR